MNSADGTEHFVTLFDSHFLLQGLSLYRSLESQAVPFHLWIVAMDEASGEALRRIGLRHATVVPLSDLEDERLRSVKRDRSVAEYCWTLTPFLPAFVLRREPAIARVTYVDADLYFFDRWTVLTDELARSGKDVLITEHGFGPEYADRYRFGRFCVQFMTFRKGDGARRVWSWWQDRCLEWCYAREEDGKFGDQKYLDAWPTLFRDEVHVLEQRERTVAPWNVAHLSRGGERVRPVFYHFHNLRLVGPRRVLLYYDYVIGRENRWIYDSYVKALRACAAELRRLNLPLAWRPLPKEPRQVIRNARSWLAGTRAWARV